MKLDMKKVLGLDLGSNSIGYALLELPEDDATDGRIITAGSRIVVSDPKFHQNFVEGKIASKNADRRTKRSIRRGYQRYKLRRERLKKVLQSNNMMPNQSQLRLMTTVELYALRSRAVMEKVTLNELGRIWYHLNQRRGFKSNRKAVSSEEKLGDYLQKVHDLGEAVRDKTIGQYFNEVLQRNPRARIRENTFPRWAYQDEFDKIWKKQKEFYPALLTGGPREENRGTFYKLIRDKIIYYQRSLKSQKHLISRCEHEPSVRVAPKSSPFYQDFRIWQQVNNLELTDSSGRKSRPSLEERVKLVAALNDPGSLDKKGTLSQNKVLKLFSLSKGYQTNLQDGLQGNTTVRSLHDALLDASVDISLSSKWDASATGEQIGGLYQLWHLTYSIDNEDALVKALQKFFGFSPEQSLKVSRRVGYTSDFGSVSTKAIRKLLPHIHAGLDYYDACVAVGYKPPRKSDSAEEDTHSERLLDSLPRVQPNSLRSPVVEQVLNQMINVVNNLIATFGKPDEVRVELSRDLKQNAKRRKRDHDDNKARATLRKEWEQEIKQKWNMSRVTAGDLLRYELWLQQEGKCLYSGQPIAPSQVYTAEVQADHILPRSRFHNNSSNNLVLVFASENTAKDQQTAFDYIQSKTDEAFTHYTSEVSRLREAKKISGFKRELLLTPGTDIPTDFVEKQLRETQYVTRKATELLRSVFGKRVYVTSGQITAHLRQNWELEEVMRELNWPRYHQLGLAHQEEHRDKYGNTRRKYMIDIDGWSKRDDHRHHAVDAIVVAATSQGIIQRLNTLNRLFHDGLRSQNGQTYFEPPMGHFRQKVLRAVDEILISFKKDNSKVLTRKLNKIKVGRGDKKRQVTWVPRGSLHEDTIYGTIKWYAKKKLDTKFDSAWIEMMPHEPTRKLVQERVEAHGYDPAKAFKAYKRNAIMWKGQPLNEVTVFTQRHTKRVRLSQYLTPKQVSKIIDPMTKRKVEEFIVTHDGIKNAFKNYGPSSQFGPQPDDKVIWLNREKGLWLKAVNVFDEGELVPIREVKKTGSDVTTPNDYVYTKGNHHCVIYENEKADLRENLVTFLEATHRAIQNERETGKPYPIINRGDDEQWKFKFSMQINDLFVFDLNPSEVDLLDPKNRSLISKHLYRVQKMSSGDYWFRHHLETKVDDKSRTLDIKCGKLVHVQSLRKFTDRFATKIRVSNIGTIVKIGE